VIVNTKRLGCDRQCRISRDRAADWGFTDRLELLLV